MSEKLLQHKHCRSCGRATNVKSEYCNEECKFQHQELLRKKRNQLYILMAIAMGIMLMTMFLGGA